jgi:hypothetical protein
LKTAILLAKANGAKGVTFYDGNALKEDHMKMIRNVKKSLE